MLEGILVSDCDKVILELGSWSLAGRGYARSNKMGYLHHLVACQMFDRVPGSQIDHINRNKLDCRRENLRLVTHSVNQRNKDKYANNTSGVKGVSYCKRDKKWIAQKQIENKKHRIGSYHTKEEAIAGYNAYPF